MLREKEKLEPYVVASVMKSFSKMKDNVVCGSDKFFLEMEPYVLKNLNNFTHDEFLNIVYSYYVRDQTSKLFEEAVIKKIKNDIHQYNSYSMLYTLTYYLLFTESTDKFLWQTMMDNFNKIKGGKVPLTYYRPFKMALFYLNKKFPNFMQEFDFFDFQDKFYGAEQYYNYVKNEKYYESDHRNFHFKSMLNVRHTIFPVPYVVFENLFIIHFTVEHKKIGFNLFFEKDTVWKSNPIRINKLCKLHSSMMKLLDWEILDITWEQYIGLGNQETRDKYIQTWFNNTCEKQKAKGIIEPVRKYA